MTAAHEIRAPAPLTLTVLMLGNIVIGAGVLAPAAMMNTLTASLAVTPVDVGAMIAWGAVVLCIGAPSLALLAGRMDRRALLIAALAVYAIGHAASALAPNFETLLIVRLLMIGGAAVYTPQAASAVTLMIAPEKRASAVAFVFLGWSFAGAAIVPMMTLAADAFGWRAVYAGLAIGAACAVAGLLARMPGGLKPPPVSLADWRRTLANPAIIILLATTAVQVTGQFTLFPYLAAELRRASGADTGLVAIALALYGAAGLIGAALASRTVSGIGAPRMQLICLAIMAAGLAGWQGFAHVAPLAIAAVFVWGLGFAAAVSMQQARLIAIAPALASASVALNTSFLYFGQAAGATIGARLIDAHAADYLGVAGCVFMLAAMGLSFVAQRRFSA